ncbi:hypothetical protein CALVIDRAFT_591750 [Calocera viscosa TUFC12733]|uniref:Uncharacterized protein n=1 Tax=Calocera viscosa (strain TUFC12733) TaxID=1330018 RepID=A0A167G720_CALVF|nr:hypothetical protein CALVIDRAFT_591750 [Calocera viscosa TUFC12733]
MDAYPRTLSSDDYGDIPVCYNVSLLDRVAQSEDRIDEISVAHYPGLPLSACGITFNTDITALVWSLHHMLSDHRQTLEALEQVDLLQNTKQIMQLVTSQPVSVLREVMTVKEDDTADLFAMLFEEQEGCSGLRQAAIGFRECTASDPTSQPPHMSSLIARLTMNAAIAGQAALMQIHKQIMGRDLQAEQRELDRQCNSLKNQLREGMLKVVQELLEMD